MAAKKLLLCDHTLQLTLEICAPLLQHPKPYFTWHRHVYTVAWFTLCYGRRVGIVHPKCHCKRIRDDRYRGGQLVTLP